MNQDGRMLWLRIFIHRIAIPVLVLLTLALTGYGLFFINRFYLKVVPHSLLEMTLDYGTIYSDPGAEVKLAGTLIFREGISVDADIATRSNVDVSVPGTYRVTYDAKWSFLEGQGSRTVAVVERTPPEIILNYISSYFTTPGEAYEEEGVFRI